MKPKVEDLKKIANSLPVYPLLFRGKDRVPRPKVLEEHITGAQLIKNGHKPKYSIIRKQLKDKPIVSNQVYFLQLGYKMVDHLTRLKRLAKKKTVHEDIPEYFKKVEKEYADWLEVEQRISQEKKDVSSGK